MIVLALFLTALLSVVFVSQQYDQYQTQASKMSEFGVQRLSEYLVFNSPGLTPVTSNAAVPGWGICTSTQYNCYNMTVSNLGGVGVQIVRIYINSTGSGCTSLCVLNPTSSISSYAFNQASQFVNRGETSHAVILALPSAVVLPGGTNPSQPAFPMNAIFIATSMGNVFSFQWPFQVIPGVSSEAYSQGIMKVAYQKVTSSYCSSNPSYCFDSKNEPGPVAGNVSAGIPGSGGTVGTGYCHQESVYPYPAPPGYAEKLTVSGLTDNNLWFVNPWITAGNSRAILDSVDGGHTTLYLYVIVVNTGNTAYSPTAGTIDLTWFASNHIDGSLIGVYYRGTFSPSSSTTPPSIPEGAVYYAIFKIDNSIFMLTNPPTHSVMFWGGASITNVGPSGTSAEDENFYSGVILSSGLWIRYEASSGSCT
jgi:hypothetical protein